MAVQTSWVPIIAGALTAGLIFGITPGTVQGIFSDTNERGFENLLNDINRTCNTPGGPGDYPESGSLNLEEESYVELQGDNVTLEKDEGSPEERKVACSVASSSKNELGNGNYRVKKDPGGYRIE